MSAIFKCNHSIEKVRNPFAVLSYGQTPRFEFEGVKILEQSREAGTQV